MIGGIVEACRRLFFWSASALLNQVSVAATFDEKDPMFSASLGYESLLFFDVSLDWLLYWLSRRSVWRTLCEPSCHLSYWLIIGLYFCRASKGCRGDDAPLRLGKE